MKQAATAERHLRSGFAHPIWRNWCTFSSDWERVTAQQIAATASNAAVLKRCDDIAR